MAILESFGSFAYFMERYHLSAAANLGRSIQAFFETEYARILHGKLATIFVGESVQIVLLNCMDEVEKHEKQVRFESALIYDSELFDLYKAMFATFGEALHRAKFFFLYESEKNIYKILDKAGAPEERVVEVLKSQPIGIQMLVRLNLTKLSTTQKLELLQVVASYVKT